MEENKTLSLRCSVMQVRFHRENYAVCYCKTADPIPEDAALMQLELENEQTFIAAGYGLRHPKRGHKPPKHGERSITTRQNRRHPKAPATVRKAWACTLLALLHSKAKIVPVVHSADSAPETEC